MDIEERFWSKVIKDEKGCWVWIAAKIGRDIPGFSVNGKSTTALRWIYERLRGPIPVGLILHLSCENRECVNPKHAELITCQERARIRKPRGPRFKMETDERFWAKVKLEDKIFPENGCMLWTAFRNPDGYGMFRGENGLVLSTRWIYRRLRGLIPKGLQLDHLCGVKACINPDHLEPVTPGENTRRGNATFRPTHCKNGHPFSEDNTYTDERTGHRQCRECTRTRRRANRKRRRELNHRAFRSYLK
jgi:hypothetical protein